MAVVVTHTLGWCIDEVQADFLKCQFTSGIISLFSLIHDANAFFQASKPWSLKNDVARRDTIIHICLEAMRIIAILLQPVLPSSSKKMLDYLAVPATDRTFDRALFGREAGIPFGDTVVLFNKILTPEEEAKLAAVKASSTRGKKATTTTTAPTDTTKSPKAPKAAKVKVPPTV